jgi:UDP-glucose 4-epimerase
MAVLVTGGAGYIGSHMAWELVDRGERVLVLDRLSTGFDWAVPHEAELVVGDIGDPEVLAALFARGEVEAVIHFAGSIVVPESVADPLGYYENNTVKSRALIDMAVRHGVKHFIFSSTAAVYGSPKQMPVTEETPTYPESPYGSSKLMTEIMLRDTAAAHDFRYTALRYFNVAGADPKGRTGQSTKGATHLIKVASEAALGKRDFIEVYGTDYPTRDGTCVRDYIHVTDLVRAHYLALKRLRGGAPSMVANCGYGRGYSVLEVLEAVQQVAGKPLDVRYAARRPGDAEAIVADPSRARKELGWKAEYDDLPRIVAHALDWERSLGRRNRV